MKMIVHEANGLQISQRRENGYINATQMCQASNRKWHEYWRLPSTQEYLTALAKDLGIDVILNKPKRENPSSALVLTFKGGNSQQGTWVHPEVAVDLAAWISVEFRILVNRWVREWMTTGQNPIPPQPTPTNAEISSLVEELENLIISIRSHGRTIHTGSHQPVDPILFKSLHTLSHNQLSVINTAIQQLELLKRIAEMNTAYGSPEQTINYLFGSPTSTQDKKPQATETRVVETNPEITESSKTAADDTETDKTKQLTNINVKIPSSQRQWLADTARQVRRNNTKPVAPSDRVYPQHLVSIAIALLQKSNIDIEAAHSIRMEQDEATANINIKINQQQQEWLTATAKTIRNSNQHPTCPHERIYPQHLIAIAVEQLQNANVRWHRVGNVNEIQQRLAKPCHLHLV